MTAFLDGEDFGDVCESQQRYPFFGVMLTKEQIESLSHNLAFSDIAEDVVPSCVSQK
jgi:hypothetical protein